MCLSPIGFDIEPEGFQIQKIRQRQVIDHNGNLVMRVGPPRIAGYLSPNWWWNLKISPMKIMRTMGPKLAKKQLKTYVTKRLNSMDGEINQALEEFLLQIVL